MTPIRPSTAWLAYCCQSVSIQAQVPFSLFLLYGPPNQWRRSQVLSIGILDRPPPLWQLQDGMGWLKSHNSWVTFDNHWVALGKAWVIIW